MTIKDLKDNGLILLECVSGSHAYGLATPTSDNDIKGVFYLPRGQYFGLDYIPQVNDATNDQVYYELGRFVELLLKNNPTALEILATDEAHVLFRHPIMEQFQLADFLSKKCKNTFAGFALSQIKKAKGLNKKIHNPMDKERKSPLHFCYVPHYQGSTPLIKYMENNHLKPEYFGLTNTPNMHNYYTAFYNENGSYKGVLSSNNSNELSLSSIPKGEKPLTHIFYNQNGYSSYCKDYKEYWDWVEKRNEDRYQNSIEHGKNYDAKNMMHTIRLLLTALEIGTTGNLTTFCKNREELLAIKSGNYTYEKLISWVNQLMDECNSAFKSSDLQEEPNESLSIQNLIKVRELLYCK